MAPVNDTERCCIDRAGSGKVALPYGTTSLIKSTKNNNNNNNNEGGGGGGDCYDNDNNDDDDCGVFACL